MRVYRTQTNVYLDTPFMDAHTHFLLASKSVEYNFRRREGEIIVITIISIVIEILRATLRRANSWLLQYTQYTQRAHMRLHSLWFSFLAFCFSFVVRLSSFSSVCFALTGCRPVSGFFFCLAPLSLHSIRMAKKRSPQSLRTEKYKRKASKQKQQQPKDESAEQVCLYAVCECVFVHMMCTAGFNNRPTLRCFSNYVYSMHINYAVAHAVVVVLIHSDLLLSLHLLYSLFRRFYLHVSGTLICFLHAFTSLFLSSYISLFPFFFFLSRLNFRAFIVVVFVAVVCWL